MAAALAKQPADRISVAVLRSRLERYLQQLPPDSDRPGRPTALPGLDQASAASPPPQSSPSRRRRCGLRRARQEDRVLRVWDA